jgi:hypothetical protein
MIAEERDETAIEECLEVDRTPILEAACRVYHVRRLELVSLLDEGPLEVDERNVGLVVTYEDGFFMPWGAEFTEFVEIVEAIYGHEVDLAMNGSEHAERLCERPANRRTVLYGS